MPGAHGGEDEKDEGDKFGFALKSHLGSEGTSLAFTAAKPKGC